MTRPIAGDETLPRWLRPGWRLRALVFGLLLFLLVFAVGWAIGAVFAVRGLMRSGNHPTVAIFLGAWLLVWAAIPVWFVFAGARHRHRRIHPASAWSARFFFGCFAVGWFAGLAGIVSQGHLGDSLLASAVTTVFVVVGLDAALHRQHVSVDPLALEIRDSWGRAGRTRRYELPLIRNPRAERPKNPDGGQYSFWEVVFEYGSKTVRFGQLSSREAEQRARDLGAG